MKLQTRLLIVLLALAALPALLIGGIAYQNARTTIELRVKARLNSIADLKRDQIVSWLADRSADARLLADNFLNEEHFSVILDPAADPDQQAAFAGFLTDNLLSIQQARAGYREVLFVDAAGTVILSTDPARLGANLAADPATAAVLGNPTGETVFDIHTPADGSSPEMVFGHVLRQVDLATNQVLASVNGAVLIRVRMDETLYPLISEWPDRGDSGETLLVRTEDSVTVFLNPVRFEDHPALTLRVPLDSTNARPAQLAAAGQDGILTAADYRGVPVLAAYRGLPGVGWGLVAKQDAAEAFAPVTALTRQLVLVIGLVLLAAAMTAIRLARALTHPLDNLVTATRLVAAGDYQVDIPVQRPDEIGALAVSFRTMLVAVRASHASLAARTEELQAFFDLSQTLLGTLETEVMLDAAVRMAVSSTRSAAGAIFLTDTETATITTRAVVGLPAALVGQRFPIDAHTAAGYALLRRQSVSAADLAAEDAFHVPPDILAVGVRASLAVPLLLGDETVGALVVHDFEPRPYSADQVRVAQTLANQTALALGRARLFDALSMTYDRTLDALVAALDARDKETEGHSQRVVAYTLALAHQMRIPAQDVTTIRRGALLHDIGKIGVPDAILLKPGPLTTVEWEVMRRHPDAGQLILAGIRFLEAAAHIIYAHHERWDGTGYPRGLRGGAIPLGAQLFAVADTYDAITSDRPYRAARSYAVARAEIEAGAGSQFAPPVVEAFLQIPELAWTGLRPTARAEPAAARPAEWLLPANLAEAGAGDLAALKQLLTAVGGTLELKQLLQETTRTMVAEWGAAAAAILLYSPETDMLELAAEHGLPETIRTHFSRFPVPGFHNERVIREACANLFTDLDEVPGFVALGLPQTRPDLGGYLCVPLTAKGRVLGLLGLFSQRPTTFEPRDVAFYQTVGEQIGLAIANARQHEAVQALAVTDSLTGGYNRRYLHDFLGRELSRCDRYEHGLSVLMLDVDHFKDYNDAYGHLAGDEALRQIVAVLRQGVRQVDLIARVGGEEFVVVLPEVVSPGGQITAERLRAALAAHAFPHGQLTASFGVVTCRDQNPAEVETLLAMADRALYHAKRSGRNCVEAWDNMFSKPVGETQTPLRNDQ